MSKKTFNDLNIGDGHLSPEQLLMYVDGELTARDSGCAKEHLETCWTCRRELEKIGETISLFVEFRSTVQLPLLESPPRNWTGFGYRLRALRDEMSGRRPGWLPSLSFSSLRTRFALGFGSLVIITALLFQFVTVGRVSAAELLESAIRNQDKKAAAKQQPVVRKKFKLRAGDAAAEMEVWMDVSGSRSKRKVTESANTTTTLVDQMAAILRANGMDPFDPLSPRAFQNWRSSIPAPVDEVSEGDPITLRTRHSAADVDGIVEAALKFRAGDLHPIEQLIVVRTESGHRQFTISEAQFEVVSLTDLEPGFFADAHPNELLAASKPPATTSSSPEAGADQPEPEANTAQVPGAFTTTASADLEVEVLRLLNSAGADLDEDITVKREGGVLIVRGLVETEQRKNAVVQALQPVRSDPSIRIQIETVAEAVARRKANSAEPPTSVEQIQVKSGEADGELVRHFGSEEDARRFASRVIDRSGRALSHAYALRRLARQFTADEIRSLSAGARAKWLALMASHARGYKTQSGQVTSELGRVLVDQGGNVSSGVEVNSADDLPGAVDALFASASSSDRAIRSALTGSAGGAKLTSIRRDQFWQSMRKAESIAEKIAAMK